MTTENTPDWVRRWDRLKEKAVLAGLVSSGVLMLAFIVLIPFLTAGVVDSIYGAMGYDSPLPFWQMVAISALLEIAFLGYLVVDGLAEIHRTTENKEERDK